MTLASSEPPLRRARVPDTPPFPEWARGTVLSLPRPVWESLARGADSADLAAAAAALRLRRAFTESPPPSSRLPFSYQRVPPRVRSLLAAAIGRWRRRRLRRGTTFPAWPLDLSADLLADLAGPAPAPRADPRTPVILSHDHHGPGDLDTLVGRFLGLEESVGARSANFVVPCAWPLDHGRLREIRSRGHELGIHGYDHTHRTPFAPPAVRRERLGAARDLIERYGILGYRAPSLVRTRALVQDLGTFYRYDSSIPTAGGPFPVPGRGCASARPFRVDGVLEIPLSLPPDGSLRFVGQTPEQIARLWIDCAEAIARARGVVVLLTHCEPRFSANPGMLAAYRRFLEHVAGSPAFRWSTPGGLMQEERP